MIDKLGYQELNSINEMDNKIPGDLLALDIRRCLHYLEEITGEITMMISWIIFFRSFVLGSRPPSGFTNGLSSHKALCLNFRPDSYG